MLPIEQLFTLATWAGYLTLFFAALAILSFFLKWSLRFRLVGATGFLVVLTGGLFALGLGLYERPQIAGAVHFTRVYDVGASDVVITVPAQITPTELEATLQQAAADIYSPGRMAQVGNTMTIRARTVVHPQKGISQLVYLGQIQRSLASRTDDQMLITIDQAKWAQLPKPAV
jgi:hypothetical protein